MRFGILGPLEAVIDGEPLPLGGPKQRAVLAELLVRRNQAVSREQLVAAVWRDDPPKTAVSSLQVHVHALRRALGADRIVTSGTAYRLRLEPGELDLERFEELVAAARQAFEAERAAEAATRLDEALALWRGTALADLEDEGEVPPVARELDERRLEAVELRNDALLALGRHDRVLPDLERLIADHPYRERLRAQHILALYRAGRQTEALESYRAVRALWDDELGIEPTPALQELERAVLNHDPSLDLAPAASPLPPRPTLPVPPTPLVGRRLEIAAVAALVRSEARLVTLVGPGGTGKTRLALAVAEELAPQLPDGAAFVDLSAVADAEVFADEIARGLGMADGGGLDGLRGHLQERELLLVLDNLEQLLDAAPQVASLLTSCPRLLVLATSRAPLRVAAEHEYAVPPLPEDDAVSLFSARARASGASLAADAATADEIATICRRLDGLPLAIELAAARAKLLRPAELRERLERSPALLGAGARDLPARQATLAATIRWSYDLLGPDERAAFARLAVFSGGWTLDAAERVCEVSLETLAALVDNSLVRQRETGGSTRFTMLETVRHFAVERLEEADAAAVRRRHADWLAELADEAGKRLRAGSDAKEWLDRLEAEHDNLRAALGWALETRQSELAVGLAASLSQFWEVRGHLTEGMRLLDDVLELGGAASAELRFRAISAAARIAFHRADFERADRDYRSALALAEELDDAEGVARCLSDIGTVAAATGEHAVAVDYLQQSADRFRELGESRRLALTLSNIGHVAGELGDVERAIALTEEARAIQHELGDREREAVSLLNLASFSVDLDALPDARRLLVACLELAFELGYKEVIAYALVEAIRLAGIENDPHAVARLAGALDALLAESGVGLLGSSRATLEGGTEAARTEIGDAAYAEAHDAGTRAPVRDVLAGAGVGAA